MIHEQVLFLHSRGVVREDYSYNRRDEMRDRGCLFHTCVIATTKGGG